MHGSNRRDGCMGMHAVLELDLCSLSLSCADLAFMADLFETLGLGPKPADVNTVNWAIYPDDPGTGGWASLHAVIIPPQQHATDSAFKRMAPFAGSAQLLALKTRCMQLVSEVLSTTYIWQLQPFDMRCSSEHEPPWCRRQRRTHRKEEKKEGEQGVSGPAAAPPCVWGTLRLVESTVVGLHSCL